VEGAEPELGPIHRARHPAAAYAIMLAAFPTRGKSVSVSNVIRSWSWTALCLLLAMNSAPEYVSAAEPSALPTSAASSRPSEGPPAAVTSPAAGSEPGSASSAEPSSVPPAGPADSAPTSAPSASAPAEVATSAPGSQPASAPASRATKVYTAWPFDIVQAVRRQIDTAKEYGIPKDLTLKLDGNVVLKAVLIPPGRFMMGSPAKEAGRTDREGPLHAVTLRSPFYMGIYAVTQEQYEKVMGKNPSHFKGLTNPVDSVSWDDAVEFCSRLSRQTGKTIQLPTEAQWEYACRAGTSTPFATGEGIGMNQANFNGWLAYGGNGKMKGRETTAPVGSFAPNAFGLYDMHGNVWQWCMDWYDKDTYASSPAADPSGPGNGQFRVVRGGAVDANPEECRSAHRGWFPPDLRSIYYGFRVVCTDVEPK
jgi:formylglycine-generating enzyme required for sulfatase activity